MLCAVLKYLWRLHCGTLAWRRAAATPRMSVPQRRRFKSSPEQRCLDIRYDPQVCEHFQRMSGEIFVWFPILPSSQCLLCPLPASSEHLEMETMRHTSSWKSDESSVDSSGPTADESVSTAKTCSSSHRHRVSGYKDYTNSGEMTENRVSSSTVHYGTVINSRYRRGHYNSYDHSRRSRHRNNDVEVYRIQQQPAQYDNLMHPHSVNGLLRQHSWSGSNVSLGSNRSRSSTKRDHRSSGSNRHGDDTHLHPSASFSVHSKLEEFDDNSENNVTYVAAGTAPVSQFRGSSCGAASSVHSTAVPITTYAAPVMSASVGPLPAYPAALNLPIEQCDLRHFDQGMPLVGSADELSSSSQSIFNQKTTSSARRNKDAAVLGKKDMQNFGAHQLCNSSHSSAAYFRHQLENDRTALTLLSMISALQQRQAAGIGRYLPDLDGKENEGVELSPAQQQELQQLTAAQIAGLLGTANDVENAQRSQHKQEVIPLILPKRYECEVLLEACDVRWH
ncbi:hypothetical protein RB195_004117 [Necator americanus]|uniref:Uncharacterized protein n=1 Tax=Necator americanus TaxID=51031 RepID=A0ABR1BGQ1_NECAM